jgi:hypothetical protein
MSAASVRKAGRTDERRKPGAWHASARKQPLCQMHTYDSTGHPLAGGYSPDLVLQADALVSSVSGFLRQGPEWTFTSCLLRLPGAPVPALTRENGGGK